MQTALDKCFNWGAKCGLRFSAKKTVAICFHRKSKFTAPNTKLHINGSQIPWSTSTRYLGLIVDDKLRWTEHLDKKISVAKRLLYKYKTSLGIQWGPKPFLIKWIYTAIVRPTITYGSLVWAHSISTEGKIRQLRRIHSMILRLLCPKRHSTPIAGLELIAHLPPLELYVQSQAINSYYRNIHHLPHDWSGVSSTGKAGMGHLLATQFYISDFRIPELSWDMGKVNYLFDKKFHINFESLKDGEDTIPADGLVGYTDGSKIEADTDTNTKMGVGCGYALFESMGGTLHPLETKSFHMEDYNTVYQAEISAIYQLTQSLLTQRRTNPDSLPATLTIFTDCKSALWALDRHLNTSKTLQLCWDSLNKLAQHVKVTISWIKAHVGHDGNEQADELAKAGAALRHSDNDEVEDLTEIPAPYSYLQLKSNEGLNHQWRQKLFSERDKDGKPMYRQTKFFYPHPDKNKAQLFLKQERPVLSQVIQFITGHAHMRRHNNVISRSSTDQDETNPMCRLCGQGEESPIHLVTECGELHFLSVKLFGLGNHFPQQRRSDGFLWTASHLLRFIASSQVQSLFPSEEEEAAPPPPPADENEDLD